MSGPGGHSGPSQQKANFGGLVQRAIGKRREEGSTTALDEADKPSKGLPGTGLKKNTQEWKDGQKELERKRRRRKRERGGSVSSSSSIPSDATRSDSETAEEKEKGQEGALGRGPGAHEKEIDGDAREGYGGDVVDSPTEEGGDGKGKRKEFPNGTNEAPNGDGHADTRHDERLNGHGDEQEHDEGDDGFDPVERIIRRDSHRARKLTDESGNLPDTLPGVKDEEPPGPRNEIVLDPRISYMHYHQVVESTGKGLEKGPVLEISPDGEEEIPREGNPQSKSAANGTNGDTNSKSGHPNSQPDPNKGKSPSKDSAKTMKSAMQPTDGSKPRKPKATARFSSFRLSRHSSEHGRPNNTSPPTSENDDNQNNNETITPERRAAQRGWSHLRERIVPSRSTTGPTPSGNKVTALAHTAIASLPITTELMAGQLPVMMLKTWLDRDEDGNRAVPVLLGSMRFRVGDSVGLREGTETGKEMFKVECEYGDGAVKWVIYRELKDFLSLHAHYKAANFGTSVAGLRASRKVEIPEFPKMSIPYLNMITGRDKAKEKPVGKAEYAQAGRTALQSYLVDLIRSVIFRPESNRLCRFFELSSLTLSLAPRGGFQGKAGYLKLPGGNASRRANQPGITPTSWKHSREPKWFIVRDTYFVVTDGPEATEYYDVFLIDADFTIERPKRVYRHGLHLLKASKNSLSHSKSKSQTDAEEAEEAGVDLDNPFAQDMIINSGEGKGQKGDKMELGEDDKGESHASQHTFFVVNSQRKLKLVAKNARQMHQFIVSMERIAAQCIYSGRNRFDSFAPLRVNCAAQWLVDGRDYFWNLSRAISMAKDRIYIHDWWISPELYLRRPGDERYRLDNLLKRKAQDGVKIFIIVYNEVSDKTTPVDSLYVKKTLTGLHPNIMLQRSPDHFKAGSFYWSHHEKLCVIDEAIAFMGGLDLCYGRWDTSQHVLLDEDHTSETGENGPVWRGKDYANERIAEFANLDKPFEDTIDRSKIPRMPWHDVGLQIVGQPARDLCRHFVQRWNMLIRTKNHKRELPFLTPPSDYTQRELSELKLEGTLEIQICRSVGPWSMGQLTKIEHSIQNAYCKSILMSDHFVYIENQFFITSTVVDGVPIVNNIGNALVDRIIRAHKEGTPWRACVVIPLLPGYTFPIDATEASSVRLILECQNRTISRGTNSIFSRLRKEGIEPDDYISFFSLRGWGKFKSGVLCTEQVYIHGKTCIIDDRLVICGSANINERSQRGDRDSELVAVVRDTDMIDGTMAGKPFKVGRYAHTLRIRLMREHVGVDVDSIDEDQLMSRGPVAPADEIETWDPDHEQEDEGRDARGITTVKARSGKERVFETVHSALSGVTKGISENLVDDFSKVGSKLYRPIATLKGGTVAMEKDSNGEPAEREDFDADGRRATGFASSIVPTLEEKTIFERRPSAKHANGKPLFDVIDEEGGEGGSFGEPKEAQVPGSTKETDTIVDGNLEAKKKGAPTVAGKPSDKEMYGAPANANENDDTIPNHDTDRNDRIEASEQEKMAIQARKVLRKHMGAKVGMNAWNMPTPTPVVNPNRFHDPLDERFWKDMWVAVAVHNTEIYRKVFRCIPDDLVTSWASYKAFANHAEKFNKAPEDAAGASTADPVKGGHEGARGGDGGGTVVHGRDDTASGGSEIRNGDGMDGKSNGGGHARGVSAGGKSEKSGKSGGKSPKEGRSPGMEGSSSVPGSGSEGEIRKASGPDEAWAEWEKEDMEALLGEIRGHLVVYPTRFLESEDLANNFLFNSDKILPLPIYD